MTALTTSLYTKSESTGASGPGRPHSDTSSAVPQHTHPHRERPSAVLQAQAHATISMFNAPDQVT